MARINSYKYINLDDDKFFDKNYLCNIIKKDLIINSKIDFYYNDFYVEIWHDSSQTEPPFLLSILNSNEDNCRPVYDHFSHLEDVTNFIISYLKKNKNA